MTRPHDFGQAEDGFQRRDAVRKGGFRLWSPLTRALWRPFTAKAGETVAYVGPSSAGKSTLLALLPRFYDLTSGRIIIDRIHINEMPLDSLRS
ncbi:MAG: ATP-binding cassette domain-containing protein [Alphaproteobacteria bacterium]|nr:ATP-binding cassette domain-containing protein [Alphaproteobacteria bacterium]MBU1281196.1 ATP-binding cassette domain-containing protein [Alphaproteobacteria bacterium]MBU1575535.1 ATP-binding cassette domain-containing protein [Alphaproteobacteria bacterium]MBU1827677.1 ATP-binding cassette domain-containing protein [Alphaproteobacteria bacterium]MBU2077679.1 ATP-binding cassette domain-containing protein [Alphaproteobacteria bacterium]